MKLAKFAFTSPLVAISVALFAALSSFGAGVQKYIEYVQTDGNEYVLLDYTPTADSVVEVDHAMQQYATPCFFCSRGNAEDADTFTLIYSNGYRWDYNRVSSERHSNVQNVDRRVVRVSGEGLWWNSKKSTTINVKPLGYQPANRMMLFASYTCEPGETPEPNWTANPTKVQLYRFRAWDDNGATLKVDLRPCVDTDGVIGLYDAVSKQIYYNLQAGKSFKAGPDIAARYEDVLTIKGDPVSIGEGVNPAYGSKICLAEGDSFTCSAPASCSDGTITATCAGYEVVADNQVVQSGTANSFTYVHPKNVNGVTLKWKWNRTATSTGVTRTWTGAGADNKASTAANWSDGVAPEVGDSILLVGTSTKDMTWDAGMKNVLIYDWTQTVDYTGTVTFDITYDETLPALEIVHNATLNGGTWTHKANATTQSAALKPTQRLYAKVGGAMDVGPEMTIQANGKGYWRQYLVNGGIAPNDTYRGGTYGGFGGWNNATYAPTVYGTLPYGSITAPEEPGSGTGNQSYYAGGGAIRLDVAGALTFNGKIEANAVNTQYYGGSGGGVYIRAGSIAGAGTIDANAVITANNAYSQGSGGRIAIVLTGAGATFDDYDATDLCTARETSPADGNNSLAGAPGTIYLETPADVPGKGWLVFKDGGKHVRTNFGTYAWPYGENATVSEQYRKITLMGGAMIAVPEGYTLDLTKTELDIRNTTGTGFVQSGLALSGGTVKYPSDDVTIDYRVIGDSSDSFAGLAGESFTFVSGAAVEFANTDMTFAGDCTFKEGVVFTVGAYADAGGPTLTFLGDVTIENTVSVAGPFDAAPQSLKIVAKGDMTIGSTGKIDLLGKGYSAKHAPSGQSTASGAYQGVAHGGHGLKWADTETPGLTVPYDSIVNPTEAGIGGENSAGGGILLMDVAGKLTVDGTLTADAAKSSNYHGSGGAINITAGELAGEGTITASAPAEAQHAAAGGGRVAVALTKTGADFSGFTGHIWACGQWSRVNSNKRRMGGAGTVYLKTAAQEVGSLTLANNTANDVDIQGVTPVGAAYEGTEFQDITVREKTRLVVPEGETLTIRGNLTDEGRFECGAGSTVVFAGTDTSRISGNVTFANLAAEAPGKAIVVDDGAVIEVTGDGALTGARDNNLTLMSATEGEQWTLKGANVALTGVALRDCQSESPITVMNGTDLGGNSANITFVNIEPGQLITWTGAADTAWGNAANWDRVRTPIATDKVLIPAAAAKDPVAGTDTVVAELTVEQGRTLSFGSKTFTVTGAATVAGNIDSAGGTLVLAGDATVTGSLGRDAMTVRLAGAEAQTFAATALDVRAFVVANPSVTIAGALTCTTFTAGDGKSAYDVAFAEGTSVTANGFVFAGDAEKTNGVLRCATSGKAWFLAVNEPEITGATVSGSDASASVLIVPTACIDGGNNVNWLFNDTRAHWMGAVSEDFANPANWKGNVVPGADDDVAVDSGSRTMVISSATALKSIAVSPNATVQIDAPLALSGSVTVNRQGTIVWNKPGTIGGNLVLLSGSKLTHTNNTTTEANKIELEVAGNVSVAAGAVVTAYGCGYTDNKGPGALKSGSSGPASHGGRSQWADDTYGKTYDSALCPTNCGSGGDFSNKSFTYAGGGAVKIFAGGTMLVDGEINADASWAEYYTGSGGSIWLKADVLTGSGSIHANGGNCTQYGMGAGGRISVTVRGANDLSAFTGKMEAYGGFLCNAQGVASDFSEGTPGTVYVETAADQPNGGTLTVASKVDQFKPRTPSKSMADIPAELLCDPEELAEVKVVGGYGGTLSLRRDAKVRDLQLTEKTAIAYSWSDTYPFPQLLLNGYTLSVHTRKPKGFDDTQVVPGERTDPESSETIVGKIDWLRYGLMLMVR